MKDTIYWFCNNCKHITDHKGNECTANRQPRGLNKRFSNQYDESYGAPAKKMFNQVSGARGRGMANGRGNRARGRGGQRGGGRGNGRSNGRGNPRGRGSRRGSKNQSSARRAEYEDNQLQPDDQNQYAEEEYYDEYEYDESQGNKVSNNNTNKRSRIEFVADSGATEHMINKSFILTDFKVSENGVIKSANKKEFADIVIDGRGNLLLKSDTLNESHIKLTNVIAAKDVSENLLSLRKLVDAGFSIYLDDKVFRVYNKENNKTIFKGLYEKPNWVVKFDVKKVKNRGKESTHDINNYSCFACIAMDNDSSEQSQINKRVQRCSDLEGEITEHVTESTFVEKSASGRENFEELIEIKDSVDTSINYNTRSYHTINIDELDDVESFKDLLMENSLENSISDKKPSEALLWHLRLGHASLTYLRSLQKKKKVLQHIDFDDSIKECEVCMLSKMEKLPFKQKRTRAERPLQLIHTDVMGPIKPVSWPGHKRYIIVFVDDFSRYAKIYSLKTKDEAGTVFENYLMTARNLLGRDAKVCYVRSDRDTEFTGGKFAEVMKAEKIELDCGPPSTPQLNGVAERFNKTIQRMTRALMCDSGLPTTMWEVAADAIVHYYNISPHKSIKYEVPLLKFSPRARCNFEYIKIFGCIAYAKLSTTDTKFSNVSIKSILVGHTSTGYTLWHPSSRKFIESKHVNFIERLAYRDV